MSVLIIRLFVLLGLIFPALVSFCRKVNHRLSLVALMSLSCFVLGRAEAATSFTICNQSTVSVSAAYARFDSSASTSTFSSHGWYNISPGACTIVSSTTINFRYFYVYAQGGSLVWHDSSMSNPICVDPSNAFDVVNANGGCATGGLQQKGFIEVDTGNSTAFTYDLTATSAASYIQTISFGIRPTVDVGGSGTVSATATSGLAVSFTSTTPSVCTVSGSTVTGVSAGTCIIAANQAGNASNSAATQVTQSITIGNGSQTTSITPMVAAGSSHSLAIDSDGTLWAWGNDRTGQLGIGSVLYTSTPQQVIGLNLGANVKANRIAAGDSYVLVIDSNDTLWVWGHNYCGNLGNGTSTDSSIPLKIGDGYKTVSVGTNGNQHTLALKNDGSIWAWGCNDKGQLGVVSKEMCFDVPCTRSPTHVADGFISVSAGFGYSVALKQDGSLWAWGSNAFGSFGDGTNVDSPVPKQIGSGYIYADAFVTTFAVKQDNTVWAWGDNYYGQLGDGTSTNRSSPVRVFSGFSQISTSIMHSIGLKQGNLWAWGNNSFGELGIDPGTIYETCGAGIHCAKTPRLVGQDYVQAAAGSSAHTIALKTDGTVWAWGRNNRGQLGDGTTSSSNYPRKVTALSNVAAVAADQSTSTGTSLAVKSDGTLWIWGDNTYGQLGGGKTLTQTTPVSVGTGFQAVAAGSDHSIALKTDGSLWAWGLNDSNQLGDGTTLPSSIPIQIGSGFVAISAGGSHNIALKADGSLWAWGSNSFGQTGNGDAVFNQATPLQIGSGFRSVSAGYFHNLAIKQDGSLWAWGDNQYGMLGVITTNLCTSAFKNPCAVTPTKVGEGYSIASAGGGHSMAIKSDGSLWAWGLNENGEFGNGSGGQNGVYVAVPTLVGSGYVDVKAGYSKTVAKRADGSFWAWGLNDSGGLGLISKDQCWGHACALTATQIPEDFLAITTPAVGNFSLGIKRDGTTWGWGWGYNGQLGDGTLANHTIPGLVANGTIDGPLDLIPEVPNTIPANKIPPFFLRVSSDSSVAGSSATVKNIIKFNAADVNRSNSVFVTAMVPSGSPLALRASSVPRMKALAAPAANTFVQVQLTATGWQQVIGGQLIPLASGVLGDLLAAQTILNGTSTTNIQGAQFCVGYGTSAAEMIATGRMRVVATIPTDPNATSAASVSCVIAGGSVATVYVMEFYNTNLDNYFITADSGEAAAIDGGSAGPGWIRTGNSFKSGGNTSVCRFYGSQSPGPNSHFYTVDLAECQGLKDQQIPAADPRKLTVKSWNFESLDFVSTPATNQTCPTGTTPVYRAYNNGFARGVDSNHRITSSLTAISEVVTRGWSNEGVVMCAPI